MSKVWSSYQQAIFADFRSGVGATAVDAVPGSGKCLGRGTAVLMFDGSTKLVEAVEVDDLLMGPDSKSRRVLETTRGVGSLCLIEPIKGDPWVCTMNHVLTLTGTRKLRGRIRDISVSDLIDECSHRPRLDADWKLFRTEVVFESQPVPFDPYIVGVWFGDGTTGEPQITNCEPEILAYCHQIAPALGCELVVRPEIEKNTFNLRFRMGPVGDGINAAHPFRRFLRTRCTVGNYKVIPQEYIINSREVRLEILAGLIDTDGHFSTGTYDWISVSKTLADQVVFLARSLGLAAYTHPKVCGIKSIGFEGTYYRVCLSGDLNLIPCKVARRKARIRAQIKRTSCTGFEIYRLPDGEFFGFELDGDGRFLLGDFTVTHNSTSLVEGLNHLPAKTTNVMMTSFSKQSVEDLQKKEPPWFVEVKTMNALGNQAVKRAFGQQQLKLDRVYGFMDKVLGARPEDAVRRAIFNGFRSRVKDLVDKAKAFLVDDAEGLLQVAENAEIDTITPDWIAVELAQLFGVPQEDTFIESARLVLEKCKTIDGTIDFNDQIWLPSVYGLPLTQFAMIVVDEAQDTSLAQMDMLVRSCLKGRIIMAGENAQAIYAWRGAGLGMQPFIARTRAKILPLSISYRCPKAIVAEAAQIVPGILAAPDAPDGLVSWIPKDLLATTVRVGNTILSRKNAPLISVFMELLGRGIPVGMQGRNIGEMIIRFIEKSGAFNASALLEYTNEWEKLEVERRIKKNPNAKVDHIRDHAHCIEVLCEGTDSVREVIDNANKLLRMPAGDKVLLSTVHRAKGLEWNRVFLLRYSFPTLPDHWMQYTRKTNMKGLSNERIKEVLEDKKSWCSARASEVLETDIEERNILYVGLTRAKQELVYVRPIAESDR